MPLKSKPAESYYMNIRLMNLHVAFEIATVSYCMLDFAKRVRVSRQLVYGHLVCDTSSTDISSTDISSNMTILAEIEAGVMKRIPHQ